MSARLEGWYVDIPLYLRGESAPDRRTPRAAHLFMMIKGELKSLCGKRRFPAAPVSKPRPADSLRKNHWLDVQVSPCAKCDRRAYPFAKYPWRRNPAAVSPEGEICQAPSPLPLDPPAKGTQRRPLTRSRKGTKRDRRKKGTGR